MSKWKEALGPDPEHAKETPDPFKPVNASGSARTAGGHVWEEGRHRDREF